MNSTIITILKKELKRFFSDKRMAFTTILLPGIMIFVMYSIMGDAMQGMYTVDEEYVYSVESVNMPENVRTILDSAGMFEIKDVTADAENDAVKKISEKDGKLDLYVVFPDKFEADIAEYNSTSGEVAPEVKAYYNSASIESDSAYDIFVELMDSYEASMANKFDINSDVDVKYDLADDKDLAGSIFSSLLPMLLLMFMFSACMAVGPESIAGEKERGTIATMLVTPTKRSHIALGKVAALSIIALLSGASSTLGTMLSLPKLTGGETTGIETNVYVVTDYILLAVVILSTIMLIVTLISIISAFAKSVKEAGTYISPLMIVVMIIGLSGMFSDGVAAEPYYYLIPMYNSVQSMMGIFSFEIIPSGIIISVISNIIYSGLGVFVLTRMFNSEKVMFNK